VLSSRAAGERFRRICGDGRGIYGRERRHHREICAATRASRERTRCWPV
jgi:hypothetical protein